MTKRKSKVTFDDTADIVIKGKVGGRDVEYSGHLRGFNIVLDDGIDELYPIYGTQAIPFHRLEHATYTIEFETLDGKAITAKIGKKKIARTARTHYDSDRYKPSSIFMARKECGAPDDALEEIDFAAKTITFTWTEEVD